MASFQLFRIHIVSTGQLLLTGESPPSNVILRKVLGQSNKACISGATWQTANIDKLGKDGFYFRIGKMSHTTLPRLIDDSFSDVECDKSPYTHVILDMPTEVCAIAKSAELNMTSEAISSKLEMLLNESSIVKEAEKRAKIQPLQDPTDFIDYIQRATSITKLWVGFSRPNPVDANKDFQKPMQRIMEKIAGDHGKLEVEGNELDKKSTIEIVKSAAATGDKAGAAMTMDDNPKKMIMRKLGEKSVNIVDDSIIKENIKEEKVQLGVLDKLRQIYRRIRGNSGITNE